MVGLSLCPTAALLQQANETQPVCAIERTYNNEDGEGVISGVINVAGNYEHTAGRPLDPIWTRLKSVEDSDSAQEGLRLELHGGKYPFTKSGKKQIAIIDFECDAERTGLEGLENDEDLDGGMARRADGEKDAEDPSSLRYISFDRSQDEVDVLKLKWLTKHACVGSKEKEDAGKKGGWGFFTWFIVM